MIETLLLFAFLGGSAFLIWKWDERRGKHRAQQLAEEFRRGTWVDALAKSWPRPATASFTSSDGEYGIAIEQVSGEVAILRMGVVTTFHVSKIQSAFALVNGEPVSARNSQPTTGRVIANAAIGGAIAGPAGAVIGAMVTSPTVKSIYLELFIPDLEPPSRFVKIHDTGNGRALGTRNAVIESSISCAEGWIARLNAMASASVAAVS